MKHFFIPLILFLVVVLPTYAAYTYTSPSDFTKTPFEPEVLAGEARIIRKGEFELFIEPQTTPWDAYIGFGYTKKGHPIRLCRYWQVSDIFEFKLRSHFNDALIAPRKNTLINFHYDSDVLKVFPLIYFPENSLKIVVSDDNGESWTMLKNTVVDAENNTVSAIAKLNKGYMIVAGFVNPKIMCDYKSDVKGVTTIAEKDYPGSFLYYYGQFFYAVIIDMLRLRSEQAML